MPLFSRERFRSLILRQVWLYRPLRAIYRSGRWAVWQFSLLRSRFLHGRSPEYGPMHGFFSICEKLREGEVKGQILLESQFSPHSPARNSLRAIRGWGQESFQPWPFFWSEHPEARLVGPHLILTDHAGRGAMEAMFAVPGIRERYHPADRFYPWQPPPLRLEGAWTSIISEWNDSSNYYHWFMDGLSRLALLDSFPPETRLLVHHPLTAYQRASLKLLGLEHRIRECQEEHLIIERFFFASPSSMTGCHNPHAVAFLRQKFLPKATPLPDAPTCFYISRKGKTRGLVNEEEILALCREKNWAVVDPEAMELVEQIALFAGARAVIALHGAALTNLLWSPQGCRVLELLAENYLNGCYEGLAETTGADYHFRIYPADHQQRIRVNLDDLKTFMDATPTGR